MVLFENNNGGANHNLLPITYGEYFGNVQSFNESLSNNDNVGEFTSQAQKDLMVKMIQGLEPAPVVMIYDINGNIQNIESIKKNSDGRYDDEATIIANAIRTHILRADDSKVYYHDPATGTYTLLDNTTTRIYDLNINGKDYYFSKYNDAFNYLKEYIRENAEAIHYVR